MAKYTWQTKRAEELKKDNYSTRFFKDDNLSSFKIVYN